MANRQRASSTTNLALRFGRIGLSGLAMLVLTAGCGGSGTSSDDSAATATTRLRTGMEGLQGGVDRGMPPTVTMIDGLRFDPGHVTVRVGTTVQWRNVSSESHTVTADPSRALTASNVQLPAGAEPFESEVVAPGQIFSRELTVAGEYRYVCRIHEGSGMVGIITAE
ncbi:MAG: plastocyanin/azurin family copper-binding protein [Vicinamibacterales bacterium]